MAGFERRVVAQQPPRNTPPPQVAQQRKPQQQVVPRQVESKDALAMAETLMHKAMERVKEHVLGDNIRPMQTSLDALSLKFTTIENELKTLKSSSTSLRDEVSGMSQASGGASLAQKLTELSDSLRSLQKSFGEYSAKKDNELVDLERKIAAVQSAAIETAQQSYERSITVNATVIIPGGLTMQDKYDPERALFVKSGSSIVVRYPMKADDKGDVYMTHIEVTPDGDVREYSIAVQLSGKRTLAFG